MAAREEPLESADFPGKRDRCRVWLGAVPEEIQDTIHRRDAIANAILQVGFKGGGREFDVEVEAQVGRERSKPRFESDNWYVALMLERPVVLAEESLTGGRHGWMNPLALEEIDDGLREDAPEAFEALIAVLAPIVGGGFFRERVLADRFVVIAEGRGPMFFPRLSGSAKGSFSKAIEDLDMGALEAGMKGLSEHGAGWRDALARALHWHLAMLETEDPWKRFQWGFSVWRCLSTSSSNTCASRRSRN